MKPLLLTSLCLALPALAQQADPMPAREASPAPVRIAAVRQTPWITSQAGTLKSETELTIENNGSQPLAAWARISVPGKPADLKSLGVLAKGRTTKRVHVAELNQDGESVTFALFDNATALGNPLNQQTLPQQKIRHWRLYVFHNSHQDIGFTDYQEYLKTTKWPGFWDRALLTDMPRSDTWPEDAKVRLQAEGVFQLDTSLAVRSADWFETLRTRLAEGRFAYSAVFGDIAHNNWGAEELARSTYYAERFLKDKTGVESTKTIVMRDEPTLSWGVIDALVQSGAKSFILQHNYDHNLWRGTTSYPELFYAQGRLPANKLLVWNSLWGGYGEDELNLRGTNVNDIQSRIAAKLMAYQTAGKDNRTAQYGPAKVTDGIIAKTDSGEWASNGEQTPWVHLAWSAPKTVHKVCLFDRCNPLDNARGGTLTFSDASTLTVTAIPPDGSPKEVSFAEKTVTWLRFRAGEGTGPNVGLSEIQVFSGAQNIAPEAEASASSTFGASKYPYPYDVATVNFTAGGDNDPMVPRVYDNLKAIAERGYLFPRVICANYDQFFDDLATHWSAAIPAYKGTIEDWWNFGAASTAYETALNRLNHDKLAAAEALAAVAAVLEPARPYPYEALYRAYENLELYDEHTWGSPTPAVDEQWRWKRNTAIASDEASTKALADAMAAINARIPSTAPTIVVYNHLTWPRSDLVTLPQASLPAHFELTDVETGAPVKYQKLENGSVAFVASAVPGFGYKTFRVVPRADDPAFPKSTLTASGSSLENRFFKITFDAGGNVTSILDKQNGSAEMVDPSAPHPLNQHLIYKEGALVGQTKTAALAPTTGPVLACLAADGATTGLDKLVRKILLYDELPRIDILNDVVKGPQIANVELGYFAFPLKVDHFLLRHEMPTGDMRPGVNPDVDDPSSEQYYSSATAFYTVNRWVDASNQRDWGVTFASLSAPLVCYGKPDLGATKDAWRVNYNTEKPWIYSMAFNNEWQCNFQKTQPGRVIFRYSLHPHAGGSWQTGRAERFGAETANPLRASVIAAAQPGAGLNPAQGQFLGVNRDNVVLTALKLAEANGQGLILRFNEIKGQTTSASVDLSGLAPSSVHETDLVENDQSTVPLDRQSITFTIPPFGFKTFRVIRGDPPAPVTGLAAACDANGCLISWNDQPHASCFELFRATNSSFLPGTGSYVATVSAPHYYDAAVKTGLTRTYYYAVRAVSAGKKSPFAAAVPARAGLAADTLAPSAPVLAGLALHPTKVTLSWQPASDNFAVKGYRVFRDGQQIADVAACFNSWLDTAVKAQTQYRYTVKAYDHAGNLSDPSQPAPITTP
jgi:hypothetical protein